VCVQALNCFQTGPPKHQICEDPHPSSPAQAGFSLSHWFCWPLVLPWWFSLPMLTRGLGGGWEQGCVCELCSWAPALWPWKPPLSCFSSQRISQQIQDLKIEDLIKVALDRLRENGTCRTCKHIKYLLFLKKCIRSSQPGCSRDRVSARSPPACRPSAPGLPASPWTSRCSAWSQDSCLFIHPGRWKAGDDTSCQQFTLWQMISPPPHTPSKC